MTGIDAGVSGDVTSSSDLKTLLSGHLQAHHAILAQITGGTLAGQTLLVVDANGTAGYQGTDYVMNVSGLSGSLTTSSFTVG